MSAKTRPKAYDRMSQAKLDSLIVKKPVYVEREHVEPKPVLHSEEEYDTLHPEETLKKFCTDVREMVSRYESNKDMYEESEKEMQDLLHYIEMADNKNANVGFKLYKQLAEVRRKRRICKNEMDLLQPIYENFNQTDLFNILSRIQGTCKTTKQQIDGRAYTVRTNILDDFMIKGRD